MHVPPERFQGFRKAYDVFSEGMFLSGEDRDPFLCTLHSTFGTDTPEHHNCLGCNFAELTHAYDDILRGIDGCNSIFGASSTFLFWLYLFIERYDQILNYVNIPDGYRKRNFPTFQKIRRWANFIKHPKAFLFSHHADFFHAGEIGEIEGVGDVGDNITIGQGFIDKYYSGGDNNSKLAKLLNNAVNVCVVFPDPEETMREFVDETKKFVQVLENNEVYREELSRISTHKNYFVKIIGESQLADGDNDG